MSSYSKPSPSFQKHIPYQKPQPQQKHNNGQNIKNAEIKEHAVNVIKTSLLQPPPTKIPNILDNSKITHKTFVPSKYPNESPDKTVIPIPKSRSTKKLQTLADTSVSVSTKPATIASSTPILSDIKSATEVNIQEKSKSAISKNTIISASTGNKFSHVSNSNNNNNHKWRRNNFPVFYPSPGYPSPRRINVPYFARGYPTADTSLYFHSGIYPPQYSPVHYPHLRQQHLTQHRFLAVSPVAQQTNPYHKYLTLNHISSLRRSRSAHGSFRSKGSSPNHHPHLNTRWDWSYLNTETVFVQIVTHQMINRLLFYCCWNRMQ